MKLYSYFRSSCSYRVRIILNLKGVSYETVPVHLVQDGGQQYKAEFRSLNAASQVPYLRDEEGGISQSVAIAEYLEEKFPEPALLPREKMARAQVRDLVELINSGIQPIQNLSVMRKLKSDFGASDEKVNEWNRFWIERGLFAFEEKVRKTASSYCFGETLTLADSFLVPQVFNARRFNVNLGQMPLIEKIEANCMKLEAFQKASPEQQPDAGI